MSAIEYLRIVIQIGSTLVPMGANRNPRVACQRLKTRLTSVPSFVERVTGCRKRRRFFFFTGALMNVQRQVSNLFVEHGTIVAKTRMDITIA